MPSKGLKDAQLDEAPETIDPKDFAPETIDPTDMPGMANSVTTTQEMPEDVSAYHRFVVKNFANSPQAAIGYLQERYPDYEIKHDQNNILMRKPGEDSYKTLDPNKSLSEMATHPWDAVKEGAMDLTDLAYDIPAGVGTTAASSAAGIAGGLASIPAGGAGALPASMAAGGATSAGLEALRQKLGSILGIPQEVNGKDVAISGALGAATPLAFGTGAGAKTVAGAALKNGLTQEAGQNLLNQQSGAVGRALPYVGQVMSGIPADTLRTARNRLPEIKALEKEGVTDLVTSTQQSLKGSVQQAKQATGKELEQKIESAGEKVDLSGVKAKLTDYLAELKARQKDLPTSAIKDEIESVESNIKNIFHSDTQNLAGPGNYVKSVSKDVTSDIDVPAFDTITDPFTGISKQVQANPNKATSLKEIIDPITGIKKFAREENVGSIGKRVGPQSSEFSYIDPGTGKIVSSSTEIPNQVSASTAFKIQDQLKELANLRKYNGGMMSRNAKSPVSTQMLENKAGEAYQALNDELERVTTSAGDTLGSSSDLKNQYRQYSQIQNTLGKYFKDPESTYSALRNLNKPQKRILLETLQGVDKQLGTDTVNDARLLDAHLRVGNNNLSTAGFGEAIKSRGKAEAALGGLGAYYGSKESGGYGGAIGGGLAGAGLGYTLGSPQAMRYFLEMNNAAGNPIRKTAAPIWNMLNSRYQQNKETE